MVGDLIFSCPAREVRARYLAGDYVVVGRTDGKTYAQPGGRRARSGRVTRIDGQGGITVMTREEHDVEKELV